MTLNSHINAKNMYMHVLVVIISFVCVDLPHFLQHIQFQQLLATDLETHTSHFWCIEAA